MNSPYRTIISRALLTMLLACAAMLLPSIARAQEDVPLRFTVNVSGDIKCDVTICHTLGGGGVCSIFSPGTSTTVVGGSGPFTVINIAGTPYPIDERIGCIRSLSIGANCCVDVCYSTDIAGMPLITVSPAANPTCPDA
jgi:hypothetical protein